MTTREQLRGALTNVLSNATNYPEKVQTRLLGQDMGPLTEKVTDVALAVFEQAHTPTDDERGALADRLERAIDAGDEFDTADLRALIAHVRRTVQGEPTDAEVLAAAGAMPCVWSPAEPNHPHDLDCDRCMNRARAALVAAAAVREKGQGHG